MARSNRGLSEVEQVGPYLEGVAKNLVERLYGPNGPAWGTRMSELEDVVVAVREALSEKMLVQALERQAAVTVSERPEEFQSCPSCGQPMAAEESKPRQVQTLGGKVDDVITSRDVVDRTGPIR